MPNDTGVGSDEQIVLPNQNGVKSDINGGGVIHSAPTDGEAQRITVQTELSMHSTQEHEEKEGLNDYGFQE